MRCTSIKIFFAFVVSAFAVTKTAAQVKGSATISVVNNKQVSAFPLVENKKASTILFDTTDATVVKIASKLFAGDVSLVTGIKPSVDSSNSLSTHNVIVGTIGQSKLIDQLIANKTLNVQSIKGKWEAFSIAVIDQPFNKVNQALVIAGSDPRGTAFGIFELSKMIGVQPFYWWADIIPDRKNALYITRGTSTFASPSVKYRGIFINDEDWGQQPWAAKTFEPETGDIGPKTYAKVFELLLRLKANLIWPAMHPSTKAFYHYPGNKQVAADYSIVVGSSHAEPMLRNNVGEWDAKTMGDFNYITNKQNVFKYWEDRVKESSTIEGMYTLGMRGVHDSGIEGVKTPKEAVPLIESIFEDQRNLLAKYVKKDITAIPQVFTAYKEVLDIYDNNLKLPDDVTIVWPDDNYGYIQRLNNEKEQSRPGGSGVYYHASYWGRPHDYLWLSSTHPALIREEMMKAYELKANRLWVLNVGDIKPLEYNIEMFMDMAYNADPFKDPKYSKQHLVNWAGRTFGKNNAPQIQNILWQYYQLAFERRPEFMGWSQTEPTTKTNYTDYNHFYYNDQARKRIDQYDYLEKQVKDLRKSINSKDADAFYQLVYYPVIGASLMNKKFLYRDKSYLYSKQNRTSSYDYASLSKQSYDSIITETDYYNNQLANGKWKHIMSMRPRDLPVYQEPVLPAITIDKSEVWSVAPEGYVTRDSSLISTKGGLTLPAFNKATKSAYFIDVFLSDEQPVDWNATTSHNWIILSKNSGSLKPEFGKKETRIWVTIDWSKVKANLSSGRITFKGAGKERRVEINALNNITPPLGKNTFIENNGYLSMYASHFTRRIDKPSGIWKIIDGLGRVGESVEALPLKPNSKIDTMNAEIIKNAPSVEYDFLTTTAATPDVTIYTLPTLPLNKNYSMRYAVSIDDEPVTLLDFKTVGRTEEWKQNVLRNNAIRKYTADFLKPGKHTLKIFMVDPGVVLDRITIDLGGLAKSYSNIEETISH